MKQLIVLTTETESENLIRSEALKEVLERLATCQGIEISQSKVDKKDIVSRLNDLYQEGKISYNFTSEKQVDINYIPSTKSKQAVFYSEPSSNWNNTIIKKQKKAFRKTSGAIFQLPIEGSDDYLEAFITDWSPFPAAAAVAVHRDHPITQKIDRKEGVYFTSFFCRNPLTGDLLPIYVTDWVKPEFGTGVVIINPAHSQVDLKFAQEIGLPIRFGLIPHKVTSNPETWITPPLIKEGTTTKTGRFDGLNIESAVSEYYSSLNEKGFAQMVSDLGVGSFKLGNLNLVEEANYLLNLKTNQIVLASDMNLDNSQETDGHNFRRINIKMNSFFNHVSLVEKDSILSLIVSSQEVDKSLLYARLLYFDLTNEDFLPELFVVQKMTGGDATMNRNELKLAVLARCPLAEVASLKKDNIEQAMRFNNFHKDLLVESYEVVEKDEHLSKVSSKIKTAILENNFQKAFADLYALQKQLRRKPVEDRVKNKSLIEYFCLAYLLADLEIPIQMDLHDTWNEI